MSLPQQLLLHLRLPLTRMRATQRSAPCPSHAQICADTGVCRYCSATYGVYCRSCDATQCTTCATGTYLDASECATGALSLLCQL